jgi:hypothetical protein
LIQRLYRMQRLVRLCWDDVLSSLYHLIIAEQGRISRIRGATELAGDDGLTTE